MFHKISRLCANLIVALAMIAIAFIPQPAYAAGPWYVSTGGDDNNDCLGPATACATINGAIGKASAGDTINVAAGTYTGTGSEVVFISKDLTLSGGWDPSFTTQSGMSTIDGQGARRGIVVNASIVATIEYFVIQNSLFDAAFTFNGGGGIRNDGDLTLNNSTLSNNSSLNCGSGGNIYNTGTLSINNSTLQNGSTQCGGASLENSGTATLSNSIIKDNSGVVAIGNTGTLVLNNSIVSGTTGSGYGISNYLGGTAALNGSSISGNSGIGIQDETGSVTLNNSSVSHNLGGGIYLGGPIAGTATVILNNSTVSSNTFVGGIYNNSNGSVALNNATIANNTGSHSSAAGGITNFGTVTLRNTILAGNTGSVAPDCFGTLGSAGYNLIGDTTSCTFATSLGDLTDVDAKLGVLIGSPAYHPLASNSPAIDTGNPAGCTDQDNNLFTTDQRGAARVGTCDIGAYEYTLPGPAVSLAIVSGSNQIATANLPFSQPLQVAALDNIGSPVSGVSIEFTAPASGASGTFADTGTNTTLVITDAGGVATASTFTANNVEGSYTVSASSPGLGSVVFNLEQIARPANDDFAAAQPIALLPFDANVNTTEATNEPNEPQNCYSMDRTVWYSFTPTESMVVQATTGSAANANLNIYQATGPGISDLQFLSCIGPNSTATFSVEANQTYYVQAGTIFGGIGTIAFSLEPIAAPANDNFANAPQIADLPYLAEVSTIAATIEAGEPNPTCAGSPYNTVWFAFTPSETRSFSARLLNQSFAPFVAVYSGTDFGSLTELGCKLYNENVTFHADAGQTYYIQIGGIYDPGAFGLVTLSLEIAPPAVAVINFSPSNPSSADTVIFCNYSYDPGNVYFQSAHWDFGDGTTVDSLDFCINHRYAADADYTVSLAVTTFDGRTASTSQVVQVRTHDVGIVKVAAPNSASSRQTKPITVSLRNGRYPETVTVDLYKSIPGGDVWIGSLTLQVPVLSGNRTKNCTFNYTFTAQDAQIGKVTFRAVATINGANDAFPADNTGISSPPTRVTR